MILLDSSVLIELFRKQNKKKTLFYRLAENETDFSISSVTHYEFGIGDKSSENKYWNELYEMATLNRKHFDRIPDIQLVDNQATDH